MNYLDLVKLTALMERTSGKPEIMVGLLDGTVAAIFAATERETMKYSEPPGKASPFRAKEV